MKRWLIAGLVAAAVAVGLTVWAFTGSDTSGFATPRRAVIAACQPDLTQPIRSMGGDELFGTPLGDPGNPLLFEWSARNQPPGYGWLASVIFASHDRYKVAKCKFGDVHP